MGLLASNMMSKEYGSNHHQCHNTRKKKILDNRELQPKWSRIPELKLA